jgi:thiamine biosynthesis lipoprotein
MRQSRPLLAAALLLGAAAGSPPPPLTRHEFSSRLMGTEARVVLFAASEEAAREAASRAFARVAALDAVMSDYREDSELMRLCRRAGSGPVRISDDLFRVLDASERLARDSRGAFDVTAGPLTHLWRRARRRGDLPDEADLRSALTLTGADKLILNDHTADLRVAEMRIDLGGIGKGYAADEAAAVLKGLGYPNALVALGGDIVAAGAPPGSSGWTVDVADLRSRDTGPRVVLRDAAVSTSGDAEQWVEIAGVRYSHIIDPRTGAALTGRRSVTVIAPRGTLSDGLATAVSVLGPIEGISLVTRTPGAAARISVADGDEIRTVTSPTWSYFVAGGRGPISISPGGFAPPDPPTRSLAGPPRPAPLAWLTRDARSLSGPSPRRTPLHAR